MRRIEKLLSDARALRVTRALRARGVDTGPPPAGGWLDEVIAGQLLVERLVATEREAGHGSEAIDLSRLAPFVARVRDAIRSAFEAERPDVVLGGPLGDALVARYGLSAALADNRRAAAIDLAQLAAEVALFSAVREAILERDLARPTRSRADRRHVRIVGGRIRRVRVPGTDAAALAAVDLGTLASASPDPGSSGPMKPSP